MVSRVLDKFVKEADALALLDHPNIVLFLDQGEHHGQAYLAIEYVAGARTLGEELETRRRRGAQPVFTPAEVRRVLLPLCHALSSAHGAGVIHRDIKPVNIILQRVEGHPLFVRVVDFGLAKFTDEGMATSMLAGTPVYMAPEQLDRRHMGTWTDVYAVGMLAMELLTGVSCTPDTPRSRCSRRNKLIQLARCAYQQSWYVPGQSRNITRPGPAPGNTSENARLLPLTGSGTVLAEPAP